MKKFILFALITIFFAGCATFTPKPITNKNISKAMKFTELKIKVPLTPEKTAYYALLNNPRLKVERAGKNVEKAQLIEIGLLPNPELSTDIQYPSGGNKAGTNNAYDIGLSWGTNKLFTKNLYDKATDNLYKKFDLELAWKEFQVTEKAKLITYKLILLKREIEKTKRAKEELKIFLKDLKGYIDNGLLTYDNYIFFKNKLFNINKNLSNLNESYLKKEINLKKLLGVSPEANITLDDHLKIPDNLLIPDYKRISKDIENNRIDLIALKKCYGSNELLLKAAIREQFPEIVISFTQSRDNGNLYTIAPGISISLPIFNHNQAKIKELRAKREKFFNEYVYRIYSTKMNLFKITKLIKECKNLIKLTKNNLENLQNQIRDYNGAIKSGEGNIIDYFKLKNALFENQVQLISLEKNYINSLIALELESGKIFSLK